MLEILQFIFSSPWVFAGMMPILLVALIAWGALIKGIVGIVAVIVNRGQANIKIE